jgi:hypothetical protein
MSLDQVNCTAVGSLSLPVSTLSPVRQPRHSTIRNYPTVNGKVITVPRRILPFVRRWNPAWNNSQQVLVFCTFWVSITHRKPMGGGRGMYLRH